MAGRVRFLNTRLQDYTNTIFSEMSALAVATSSINLGQGFPDTDGPDAIKQAAIRAIEPDTSVSAVDGSVNSVRPSRCTKSSTTDSTSIPTAKSDHGRRDRGHCRLSLVTLRAGRRGRALRALLRLLPPPAPQWPERNVASCNFRHRSGRLTAGRWRKRSPIERGSFW